MLSMTNCHLTSVYENRKLGKLKSSAVRFDIKCMNEVIKPSVGCSRREESENLPTSSFRGSVATLFLTEQDLSVAQIYVLLRVLLCVDWIAIGFSKYLQYANTISGNM